MSRWLVGSSRTRNGACWTSALAIRTRWRSPPQAGEQPFREMTDPRGDKCLCDHRGTIGIRVVRKALTVRCWAHRRPANSKTV